MPKNVHCTFSLISYASKVMLKILQARLQQYMNRELPDVQPGFRKSRGTRNQIANICWIIEKAREFQKNIYFCFIDYAKPLTVWITTNCGKFLKRNTRPPYLPPEKPVCRSRSNSSNWTWNKGLVQNWEGICQGYKLSPCFFNVKSASYEMPGWMNHRLESRLLGEISMTSDMQMTSPLWQETERN